MRTTNIFFASFIIGCSSASAPAPGPSGFQAPPEGQGFQVGFARSIAAGQEVHVCKEFVVPATDVGKFEVQAPAGTHHVLVYRTPKKAADVTSDVFDCGDVPGPTLYEQSADGTGGDWPPGIGVKLAENEVIRVELHALNLTSAAADAATLLDVWRATGPLTAEAGSFFMYDRDIAVAAHGKATTKMHCTIPDDITILDILPHVHVHGVGERISLRGGDLTEPKEILTTKGYGDQETRRFDDGSLVVKAGQSLDFECDYQNDTDENVVQGPSKLHNEMCMILGDYYPKMETAASWCTLEGSGPQHDGDKTCFEAAMALQAGGANPSFDQMETMVSVCGAASTTWNDLGNCAFNHCSDLCPGPDCGACAIKSCGAEFSKCQQAKCE